jgi:hypothetical protein
MTWWLVIRVVSWERDGWWCSRNVVVGGDVVVGYDVVVTWWLMATGRLVVTWWLVVWWERGGRW